MAVENFVRLFSASRWFAIAPPGGGRTTARAASPCRGVLARVGLLDGGQAPPLEEQLRYLDRGCQLELTGPRCS
jgi:hypothetical protein